MHPVSPSLRKRLFVRLLFPVLTLLALSASASYFIAQHYADVVYDGCVVDSVSSHALIFQQETAASRGDKTYFKATSNQRGYLSGYPDLPPTPPDAIPYRGAQLFNSEIDGAKVRVATLDVPGTDPDERIELQVAETQRKRRDLSDDILFAALTPQLLVVIVAGLAIWFGVRNALKPLNAVAATISGQTHYALQPIAQGGVPTEVRPLTDALNALLSRLDAVLATQRKFVADAAHQLRTPLAALKLHLDQARGQSVPEDVRAMLDRLRVSTDRAARLSHQLLSLAQVEPEAALQQRMQRLDLRPLAQECGAEWVPRALRKQIDLGFSAEPGAMEIVGNDMLLREAIDNLLENAIKYHPGNGRVTLSVEPRADEVCLCVEDDGSGIPLDQRGAVVQRFYRGDRKAGEGAGLGLAIAKEIAGLHGGSLHLLDGVDGRGLRVELRLRKAAETESSL